MEEGVNRIIDQALEGADAGVTRDLNAPGQVGRRAIKLLIDVIGDAADRLPQRDGDRGDIQAGR